MAERFYISSPLAPGPVTLDGPEARHLAAVCRFGPGDHVCLFNGDGREYPACVIGVAKGSVDLQVESVAAPQRELPCRLEVAAPLPKGDRAQFLIEKLTELGVATYRPLECRRSVVHPGDRKLEKLERYVIEASKQCGRNVLMRIEPPAPWGEYATATRPDERRWLAHPHGAAARRLEKADAKSIRVAVGPEGGFTDEEVALGLAHGWEAIDLGRRILRIETAALALAVLAQAP